MRPGGGARGDLEHQHLDRHRRPGLYAGHDLGFVDPALYRIARSARYHRAFHDITTGNNTVIFPPQTFTGYRAAPGWDPVTGLGTPDARILIPLLIHYASP